MDEPARAPHRHTGLNPWRAGCGETRTSGSEGGPQKPTGRKADRALRPDPYTYVPTWSGMAFTAFVSDVFSRRIVGWRTAPSMPTELPLDALEMALWARARAGEPVDGLVHHSDAGSQYTAIRYASRLLDAGAVASIGSVGDSYDCESEQPSGAA